MTSPIEKTGPSEAEFVDLHRALVAQLPELEASWWLRVQQAKRAGATDALRLLYGEAQNRLDHANLQTAHAVLRVLFRALGIAV